MIQKQSMYDPKAKTKRSLEYIYGWQQLTAQSKAFKPNGLIINSQQPTARAGTRVQS